MRDSFGRTIDYIRISITDRCNLRCRYCMPEGCEYVFHDDVLRYEELLRLCSIFAACGIRHYKVTGGEPLVRRGAAEFMRELKRIPGVETVTVTTNGILLPQEAEKLAEAGIDGVNISLDADTPEDYERITGRPLYDQVMRGMQASLNAGLKTKLNCVLLADAGDQIQLLAEYAERYPVDVRFIELMPIGAGQSGGGLDPAEARNMILEKYPDLHPIDEKRGNGPARYEASKELQGRIGLDQCSEPQVLSEL